MVASVRELLMERSTQLMERLSTSLKQYFDPSDGQLPQRLDRLLKRDGELETLLTRHLGDEGSTLARTLARLYVGEASPSLKVIIPDQADGVIAALTKTIQQRLGAAARHVLKQFSLDDGQFCSLSHLLKQIVDVNGKFRTDLSEDIPSRLCGEFSLDNEEGAAQQKLVHFRWNARPKEHRRPILQRQRKLRACTQDVHPLGVHQCCREGQLDAGRRQITAFPAPS